MTTTMSQIRCPKCGKLLGFFNGSGEVQCPRCRKDTKVYFDTDKRIIEMRASRTPLPK